MNTFSSQVECSSEDEDAGWSVASVSCAVNFIGIGKVRSRKEFY